MHTICSCCCCYLYAIARFDYVYAIVHMYRLERGGAFQGNQAFFAGVSEEFQLLNRLVVSSKGLHHSTTLQCSPTHSTSSPLETQFIYIHVLQLTNSSKHHDFPSALRPVPQQTFHIPQCRPVSTDDYASYNCERFLSRMLFQCTPKTDFPSSVMTDWNTLQIQHSIRL